MSYYGQLMDAELASRGLAPDGKPLPPANQELGGDQDIHGGHPDLPKEPPAKPRAQQTEEVPATDQAGTEAIEGGYPLP